MTTATATALWWANPSLWVVGSPRFILAGTIDQFMVGQREAPPEEGAVTNLRTEARRWTSLRRAISDDEAREVAALVALGLKHDDDRGAVLQAVAMVKRWSVNDVEDALRLAHELAGEG